MRLIIVRHGSTDSLEQNVVQHPETPLNERGLQQARLVARALKAQRFDAAYTSDFQRAVQTAGEILAFHPSVSLHRTKRLQERHAGVFRGRPAEEYFTASKASGHTPHAFRPEGGENMFDAQRRVVGFYHIVARRFQGKTVLFVSHGTVMTCLILHLLNKPFEEYGAYRFGNTGYTIIDRDANAQHTLHTLNALDHLPSHK